MTGKKKRQRTRSRGSGFNVHDTHLRAHASRRRRSASTTKTRSAERTRPGGSGRSRGPVLRRRRGRTVRSAYTRVVLRATPREADARVSDGVTLHLVDRHLSCVTVDELDETAPLSGRDLDVGDLAKALEERAQLVLGDVAREAADKDSRVVGIGELVHRERVERSLLLLAAVSVVRLLLLLLLLLRLHPVVTHAAVRCLWLHHGVSAKLVELLLTALLMSTITT